MVNKREIQVYIIFVVFVIAIIIIGYLRNEKSNASQYTLVSDEIKDVNATQQEFELDDTNLIK